LVSLSVYIVLEAIPKIVINPKRIPDDWWFIGVAGAGLAVNTIGTLLFAVLSGGHGHSHAGGGGHGHSHDHDKKKKAKHGHGDKKRKETRPWTCTQREKLEKTPGH